jgi:phosphatidylglycerophosphate synthase
MLSEKFGHAFDKPLQSLAEKIHFSPNTVTVAGFLVTVLSAYVLSFDLFLGGIIVLAGGFFDMFDGIIARNNNKTTRFGAFLDSFLDRVSDALIFLGIAWNFNTFNNRTGIILCLTVLVGSFLISYARARAEGLGAKCTVGIMERPERIILISFGLITGLVMPILWIMLVLTWFTVFQRIYHVWRAM